MTRSMSPSRHPLSRAARRLAMSDDSGATLLIALIIVTVVSVGIAAILSFVDTNMRGTIAVRAEAAQAAAADGAAQVAINSMRKDTFGFGGSGSCLGTGQLALPNFYQAGGASYSAVVDCTVDQNDSATGGGGVSITPSNRPGNAILTLGRNYPAENGVSLNAEGSQQSVIVHGSIFSNSNITVDNLVSNTAVTARGTCSGNITASPLTCNFGLGANAAGNDPDYQVASGSKAAQAVPACRGDRKVVQFTPGLYTNRAQLNNLTNNCTNGIFWFPPGSYFFDFSGTWTLGTGWLVGGTRMPGEVIDGRTPDLPGSCETPVPPDPVPPGGWVNPGPDAGVQFVFGGESHLHLNQGSMELCGSYSTSTPPVAFYGLKADDGPVQAEDGCVTAIPGRHVDSCAVISSDNSPFSEMFIQGTTYVPRAAIDIELNNATGQVFRYGVVARSLTVNATGSADLSGPIIEVPDTTTAGDLRTVIDLRVFVCPGSSCSDSGNPQLLVRFGLEDPSGIPVSGQRQITVYSWSVQR